MRGYQPDGRVLTGEVIRLQAILDSGVIPDSYTSIVTKKTYGASPEELKEVRTLPPAVHSIFCKKLSRKNTSLPQSEINLFRPNGMPLLKFFVEHKTTPSYPSGEVSKKVKQGFIPGDVNPKFA